MCETQKIKTTKSFAVLLPNGNGKYIHLDTVYYGGGEIIEASEVKAKLVRHDGYNPVIVVKEV